MKLRILLFLTFSLLGISRLLAFHIVGGEIYYECLGNNQYKIIIKMYRDCNGNGALFDGDIGAASQMKVGIFKADGTLFQQVNPIPTVTPVVPSINNPCLVIPPNVCVQQGYYEFTITLPANPGGYNIVYVRCCRNLTINNLQNPSTQGATYVEHIPDPANGCNNGPYFTKFPPVIICANEDVNFDHSATDPDGDSLVYEFCDPYIGGTNGNPAPFPSPPPFTTVTWAAGYNANNPIDASPPFKIDRFTGLITGVPTKLGQYVVGVCVKEYKNGVLINTHRRDFQFNIAQCNKSIDANIFTSSLDSSIVVCGDFKVSFINNSLGASNYFWNFGDTTTTADTAVTKDATYVYPDTGIYNVMLIANPGLACSDTDFVEVRILPIHKSNFTFDAGCPYEPVVFTDSSYTDLGFINSWEWFFGNGVKSNDTNPQYIYNSGTSYNVTLVTKTNKGCRDAITKKIELFPMPDMDFSFDSTCLNIPVYFTNNSTINNSSISQFTWDFGNGLFNNDTNTVHTYTLPGAYNVSLSAITSDGCMDTITKLVNIEDPPDAFISLDTAICIYEKANITASGGMYYKWVPPIDIENDTAASTVVSPKSTITYTVTVADDCYFDTDSVTITVNPLPIVTAREDTSIFRRDSVRIFADGTGHIYKWNPPYRVSFPDSSSSYASPYITTTYEVTNIDSNGCANKTDVKIYVREVCNSLFIPNAFSPNGDGINDYFTLIDYGDSKLLLLQIFNRWGELIFETKNLENPWDGRHKGIEQGIGSYAYKIIVDCGERIVQYGGNVTLIK